MAADTWQRESCKKVRSNKISNTTKIIQQQLQPTGAVSKILVGCLMGDSTYKNYSRFNEMSLVGFFQRCSHHAEPGFGSPFLPKETLQFDGLRVDQVARSAVMAGCSRGAPWSCLELIWEVPHFGWSDHSPPTPGFMFWIYYISWRYAPQLLREQWLVYVLDHYHGTQIFVESNLICTPI